jgi:hypothetical protein
MLRLQEEASGLDYITSASIRLQGPPRLMLERWVSGERDACSKKIPTIRALFASLLNYGENVTLSAV